MCLYPIKAVKYKYFIDDLKYRISIVGDYDLFLEKHKNQFAIFDTITLKCNKCFECLQEKSNEWAFRIFCETQCHKENCFITLTYANDNDAFLSKRDLQLFIKRLRKKIAPIKIRYFACGEYGSKRLRPHYHIILFGFMPKDLEPLPGKDELFNSHFISDLWQKGFISVGKVSLNSSKYCAKYLQKLNEKNKNLNLMFSFFGDIKPFLLMSTKPGIGLQYFEENLDLIDTDKIYAKDKYIKLPRYFLDVAENKFGLSLDDLKKNRSLKSSFYGYDEELLKIKRKKIREMLDKVFIS